MTTADRPLLGIALMLAFCICAPFGDALGKFLGATVPLFIIVTSRFVAQVVLLGPLCVQAPKPLARRHHLPIIASRALLHIAGITCMFAGLKFLPLADAVAIAFVMPFIMLLLGWKYLGETVGPIRLAACAVGFIGTLFVVQPAFSDVGWPALFPLAVAVIFALFMLQTRRLAKEVGAIPLQFLSGLVALVVLIPTIALGTWLGIPVLTFGNLTGPEFWMLCLAGAIGTVAHLFMTWSLRFAPSATLAPMQYLEIPVATLIGLWMFGDFPNGLAAIGICITIAAGLFIIWREQVTQRQAQQAQIPEPPAAG